MEDNRTGSGKDTTDILHHIGLINSDLNTLSACYEKLGFLLTPLSLPKIVMEPGAAPRILGAGNRHAIFGYNYLELLGIVDADKWAAITKEHKGPYDIEIPLKRYQGLHVMHLGTDHIERVKERLARQGTPCSDIKNFQRNVQTATGEQTMKARTIHFPSDSTPEGLLQIAQHDTPELVFQPRYMLHRNGATELTEITICTATPVEYASRYEQYSGHKSIQTGNNHFIVDLGHSKIKVISPDQLEDIIPGYKPPALPFMAAFTVRSRDLQLARNILSNHRIPFSEKADTLIVGPEYAGGCTVVFEKEMMINDKAHAQNRRGLC